MNGKSLIGRGIKAALRANKIEKKLRSIRDKHTYRARIEVYMIDSRGYREEMPVEEIRLGERKTFQKEVFRFRRKRTKPNKSPRGFEAIYRAIWKQTHVTIKPIILYDRLRKLKRKGRFRGDNVRRYDVTITLIREREKR